MKHRFDAVLVAGLLILIWQLIIWLSGVPAFILPSPYAVMDELISQWRLIGSNALITIIEVILGLIIGSSLGVVSALSMMIYPSIRRFVLPALVFSQTIPVSALAPLLTLWLGYGLGSKIAMAVLIIYFPVASNFYDGLKTTHPGLIDLAGIMNARPLQLLLRIRIPYALPSLASGLKLAAVYAPIGAVIGEWVGASKGLGYLMLLANGRAKIDLMFAALLVLALFTICLHWCVGQLAGYLNQKSGLTG